MASSPPLAPSGTGRGRAHDGKGNRAVHCRPGFQHLEASSREHEEVIKPRSFLMGQHYKKAFETDQSTYSTEVQALFVVSSTSPGADGRNQIV